MPIGLWDVKVPTLSRQAILKPIWTYGIQLHGPASTSDIEILERFRSKTLRMTGRTFVRAEYGYPKGSRNANS
jgi:hypothetical protein